MKRILLLLWSSLLVQGMAWLLIPLLVLDKSGPGLAGLSWVMVVLPYVVFGFYAGQAGDRQPRKRVLLFALILMILASSLIVIVVTFDLALFILFLAAFLLGSARPFADSALLGVISDSPNAKQDLALAVAGEPAGRVLGAGVLALAFLTGPELASWLLLSLVLFTILLFPGLTFKENSKKQNNGKLIDNLKVLLSEANLRRLVFFGVAWNVLLALVIGGLAPVMLKELFSISDSKVSLLVTGATALAFLASLLVSRRGKLFSGSSGMARGIGLATVCLAIFSLLVFNQVPLPWPAPAFLLFAFANQIFITNLIVQRQLLAPAGNSSLVATSSRMITWLGLAFGTLVFSFSLELLDVQTVLYLSLLFIALLSIVFALFLLPQEPKQPSS